MKNKIYMFACMSMSLMIIVNLTNAFLGIKTISQNYEEFYINLPSKGTIVIDSGHGGEDGGTVGVNGVYEKDINLEISLILYDIFTENGYEVIMTRTDDSDLADQSLDTVSERKNSDLANRLKLINSVDADLVISIHQNYFEEEQYSGTQVFYSNENSIEIAETIQSYIVANLQVDNNRLAKEIDGIYLLENSISPMVIIECGFLSNYEEAELLLDTDYITTLSTLIYKSVNEYLLVTE